MFFAGELACFVIDNRFFALDVFFGGFGVEVEKFQKRFCFAVLVVTFNKLVQNFLGLCRIAESEACFGPQELELFIVRVLGESIVEHRERLVKVLLGDGVFECHLEALLVGDEELFEAFLEVRFWENSLDDVCDLSFIDHVDFRNGLHAEHLDESHVFAVVATHDAKREVHACGKLTE